MLYNGGEHHKDVQCARLSRRYKRHGYSAIGLTIMSFVIIVQIRGIITIISDFCIRSTIKGTECMEASNLFNLFMHPLFPNKGNQMQVYYNTIFIKHYRLIPKTSHFNLIILRCLNSHTRSESH